ncbi:uncharacterized protein Dere_GG11607 [Drosophila erecta]|uniref:GG11607 n=2 Tax=Drosophila erecta TaxID=7220 RepID=B3P5R3_DROER|nr:uncharacterized protein Dere_GG11607 [Drosophila erecta]
MHDLKYLWTCLSLYFFVGSVRASCHIEPTDLAANYLFLSNISNVIDIQRSDIVEIGHSVHLLCSGTLSSASKCNINNAFSEPLSSLACEPPDAVVINVQDTSCPFPSTTFAVGFNFNGRFMELYRNCFNISNLAFQHSIYKAYRYVNNAQRINAQWKSDQISGQFDNAYERRTTQACLSTTLGAAQPQCKFDRGHMTPASAFISTALKKATFRYLNAIPQYEGVNRGKWKTVESWVNNMVRGMYDNPTINNVQIPRTYDVLKVCIGVLGVHTLKHNTNNNMIPIYLLDNSKIPVPMWIYKIVSHLSGDKWVMLTYNDRIRPSDEEIKIICEKIPCHWGLNLNERPAGNTVCCKPAEFITKNAAHLTGVC